MPEPVAGWKFRGDGQWQDPDVIVACCTPEQDCTTLPHEITQLVAPSFQLVLPSRTHASVADHTCRITLSQRLDLVPQALPEPGLLVGLLVGLAVLAGCKRWVR